MDVLLINCPFDRLRGYRTTEFHLGLGYLASVLEKHKYEVGIYDAENSKLDEGTLDSRYATAMKGHNEFLDALDDKKHHVWNEVYSVINQYNPNIVGITSMSTNFKAALNIAKIAKHISKNIFVVYGGPHASVLESEKACSYADIDYIIRGEGELSFLSLVDFLYGKHGDISLIPSLLYKVNDSAVKQNQRGPLIEHLDNIPFPARHLLLNIHNYPSNFVRYLHGTLSTGRGCPYNCSFCSSQNVWGKSWRIRSAENIIEELKDIIRTYELDEFYFWDDTFTANKSRLVQLCSEIKKLNIKWSCSSRIDTLDKNILAMMKESGCKMISFGIESGSERILKRINKRISLKKLYDLERTLRELCIDWAPYFMIGFPYETTEDIERTFELIRKLKPTRHYLAIVTPYPGTPLFDEVLQHGLFPEELDWSMFATRSPYNAFVTQMPKEVFFGYRDKLIHYVDRYNNRTSLKIRRTIKHIRHAFEMLHNDPIRFFGVLFRKLHPRAYF